MNHSNGLENSLQQVSFNLSSMEQTTSNLMVSTNFSLIQDTSHSLIQELETYCSFLSHSNL